MPWASAVWRIDRVVRSGGRGVIGWIDTADVALVATAVLVDGQHDGAEQVLNGRALLDGRGVARELSEGLGRRAGRRAGQQFKRVARRGLDGVDAFTDEVERITGTPARPLSAWAHERQAVLLGKA